MSIRISRITLHRFFTLTAVLFLAVTVQAQPSVTSVQPRQNEINVSPTGRLFVTFSQDIQEGTLTPANWLVYGSQQGRYSGSINYDTGTLTAQFIPDVEFKEGEIITSVLTANVRGNTGLPLAPAFQWRFTVAVEYGTGDFSNRLSVPVNSDTSNPVDLNPVALFAADLNNDRFVDLAVVNRSSNSVTVLLNDFFTIGSDFIIGDVTPVGLGPTAITGGDFDGDGSIDLAVSNFDDNSISVLRNNGSGGFSRVQTFTTAEHPTALESADFDNDGDLDLAVVVLGVNRLQLLANPGNGVFALSPQTYFTGFSPLAMAPGDFDNDGDVDIAVSNSGENTITIFQNDGFPFFSNDGDITVPDFPSAIRTADLVGRSGGAYGDGILDLAVIHPNINEVTVLENRSRDGDFVVAQREPAGESPAGLWIADIDTFDAVARSTGLGKDHDLDLLVTHTLSEDLHLLRNEFNNTVAGSASDVYSAGRTPNGITAADFDRDGDIDLAVANVVSHNISILINDGGIPGGFDFGNPPQLIDFGDVYVGRDSTIVLTLLNPTSEAVDLTQIDVNLQVYSISDLQATIPARSSFDLSVTFTPDDTLLYQDVLSFNVASSTVNEDVAIALRGQGIRAIIDAVPDTLSFGDIVPPQTASLPLQIINRGNGALLISDMQFTDPAFSTAQPQLSVPPHSTVSVDIDFAPVANTAYLDTLLVANNDSASTPLPVILLGGPNQFPPQITSPDTITATEDVLLQYIATAVDPDGTTPLVRFENLPLWLNINPANPAQDEITGTPGEGTPDTTFRVIASDGRFADTLDVYVRVIPVNDPPQFIPLVDQVTTELTLLTFNVVATDPEDSTLALTTLNLPQSATFQDNGDKSGSFSWVPPVGSSGVYNVSFIATEVFEQSPLSDTLTIRITVGEALADIQIASLGLVNTNIALDQTRVITGVVEGTVARVSNAFRVSFLHDGITAKDTVITALDVGQQIAVDYQATFNRIGNHEIIFVVDADDNIPESDEDNNRQTLLLKVSRARLVVRPNPFTPNDDGFNDEATFDFNQLVLTQPQLKIFNFNGVLLESLAPGADNIFRWNGRDDRGKEQKPGIYLYVLSDNARKVSSGYVVLAR